MYCNKCRRDKCVCVLPYYAQAPLTEECHDEVEVLNQFLLGMQFEDDWNIPGVGQTSILHAPGIISIPLGAFLWNKEYGYFEITSYDQYNETLQVRNNGTPGNKPPGTFIPKNIPFILTDGGNGAALGGSSSGFPYLAVDFTAPDVNACIPITLTTTAGLSVGKDVTIGSGRYTINAITSGTTATICNNGSGITPGTPVIAKGADGAFIVPVVLIDQNPCTSTPATQGKLLICANNTIKPLTSSVIGHVPTIINTSGEVALRLPVDSDVEGDLTANIASLQAQIDDNEASIAAFQSDISPCTLAQSLVTGGAMQIVHGTVEGDYGTNDSSLTDLQIGFGPIATTIIQNPSTCRNMHVFFTRDLFFDCYINGSAEIGAYGIVRFMLQESSALGTILSPPTAGDPVNIDEWRKQAYQNADPTLWMSERSSHSLSFILAPGQEIQIKTRAVIQYVREPDSGSIALQVEGLKAKTTYLGIAL